MDSPQALPGGLSDAAAFSLAAVSAGLSSSAASSEAAPSSSSSSLLSAQSASQSPAAFSPSLTSPDALSKGASQQARALLSPPSSAASPQVGFCPSSSLSSSSSPALRKGGGGLLFTSRCGTPDRAHSPLSLETSTESSSASSSRATSPSCHLTVVSSPAVSACPAPAPHAWRTQVSPGTAACSPALSPLPEPLSPRSPQQSSDSSVSSSASASSSSPSFTYGKDSSSQSSSSGSKAATRRGKRVPLSPEQKSVLEDFFLSNHYPTREEKTELGHRIKLSSDKVHKWYDNRRTKMNKEGRKVSKASLSSSSSSSSSAASGSAATATALLVAGAAPDVASSYRMYDDGAAQTVASHLKPLAVKPLTAFLMPLQPGTAMGIPSPLLASSVPQQPLHPYLHVSLLQQQQQMMQLSLLEHQQQMQRQQQAIMQQQQHHQAVAAGLFLHSAAVSPLTQAAASESSGGVMGGVRRPSPQHSNQSTSPSQSTTSAFHTVQRSAPAPTVAMQLVSPVLLPVSAALSAPSLILPTVVKDAAPLVATATSAASSQLSSAASTPVLPVRPLAVFDSQPVGSGFRAVNPSPSAALTGKRLRLDDGSSTASQMQSASFLALQSSAASSQPLPQLAAFNAAMYRSMAP